MLGVAQPPERFAHAAAHHALQPRQLARGGRILREQQLGQAQRAQRSAHHAAQLVAVP